MKYSTVLFDLDGTLTDPVQGICRSVRFRRIIAATTVLLVLLHLGIAPFINPHGVYFACNSSIAHNIRQFK